MLAAVKCDEGRYYGGKSWTCVTADECRGQEMYPYALAMACTGRVPDTDTGLHLNDDGAYECPSDKVTIFDTVVRCVSSLQECGDLYLGPNKSACVTTASDCDGYLKLSVYEENGEKLCLTGDECKAKGAPFRYSFYYCKSAAKCAKDGLHAYVIGGAWRCREESPDTRGGFDPTLAESGVYKCEDAQTYPDFSANKVRCVRAEDCKSLYYNRLMCLTWEQCKA